MRYQGKTAVVEFLNRSSGRYSTLEWDKESNILTGFYLHSLVQLCGHPVENDGEN